MVINITTDNANTFQGFEASQRVGVIEEHYTTEFKYGEKLKDDAGLFLYGGISDYLGASSDHAPLTYGGWNTTPWCPYAYDEKVTTVKPYNAMYDSLSKVKLHGQYTKGDFDFWVRYTQGGENVDTSSQWNIGAPFGIGYRQTTAAMNYKQELADNFALRYLLSYGHTDVFTPAFATSYRHYGEDDYYGQVIANWKIRENQEFAFGGAWRHDELGLPPWGEHTTMDQRFPVPTSVPQWWTLPHPQMPRWRTDMFSVFGEYQWRLNRQWTAFVSARADDHTYTAPMFSPRSSIVYAPTDVDTLKVMASRSVRTNNDAVMEATYLGSHSDSEVEILEAYEARYERRVGDHLLLAADTFIHNQDVIGWVSTPEPGHTGPTGTEELWGIEAEASYVRDRFRFDVSHGYTKLLDYGLPGGAIGAVEDTAAPAGYGNDLNNWYNNISKMRVRCQMDDGWTLDGSLIVYWDSPGGEDYANWVRSWGGNYDPRARDAFYNNWYLNLGLQYQCSKTLSMRLDAYNVLGVFDEGLNKRREGMNWSAPAEVRYQAPALGLQLVYKLGPGNK
jgi:outer membrane receptor for ferrienterochelin and colicins